jgi:hypothetical protein
MKVQVDKALQTAGDGVYATFNISGTTLTFTSNAKHRNLREGSNYCVYDTTLATNRGTVNISSIDPGAGTAVITSAAPAGTTNGDKLLPEGLTGANPTWLFGLPYHMSTATTWMGLSRTTYPNLKTPTWATSSGITQSHIRFIKNQVEMLRGNSVWDTGDWSWYCHPSQRQGIEELGWSMSLYDKTGGRDGFDPMFDVEKLRVDGIKLLTDANADPTRFDLVDFKNWGRGETLPVGLYDVDDDTIFPIYGASGGLAAAEIFYIAAIMQFFVDDPVRGAFLSSVSLPPQYI